MPNQYTVLLYYIYTKIEDPEAFREEHHEYCLSLNLLGRIYISSEGLNGTISGLHADCEAYMLNLKTDPRFTQIQFKIDTHNTHTFQKLHVRTKREIVNSGLTHIDPKVKSGKYIKPNDLWKDKSAVLLDVRSNYEHKLGKFKGSLTLDIENFREFSKKIDQLSDKLAGKKIVTICTGGIKCEKASAYLLEKGYQDVYQLHGGIIQYRAETDGRDFEGKCYVFDNRIAIDINRYNPTTISNCTVCSKPCARIVNCSNPKCNIQTPICNPCAQKNEGACSETCKNHPERRQYNTKGYYPKNTHNYNPYKGLRRKKYSI